MTVARAPDGPWVKALAVVPAVAACPEGSIVMVADADVWTDGLGTAAQAVENGAPWAIPHQLVHRLDEAGTAAVLAGADWRGQPVCQKPYTGIPGGGIVVARRETLLDVPMDPAFVGWGQEDECHAMALTVLAGPPWRGTADLVHLFHPPQARLSRRHGSQEGWNLRRRYIRARHDPPAMRRLLDEADLAFHPPEHPLHDLEPHRVD